VDIFIHRLLHWQFCNHLPFSVSHSLPIFFTMEPDQLPRR
jgi:hypothetical protein